MFSRASVLRAHQQEWCQLRLITYPLSITPPHNLRQLPFSPPIPLPPPPPTEYDGPLGPGGHARRPPIADEDRSHGDASPPLPIPSIDPPYPNVTSEPTKTSSLLLWQQVHVPHSVSSSLLLSLSSPPLLDVFYSSSFRDPPPPCRGKIIVAQFPPGINSN